MRLSAFQNRLKALHSLFVSQGQGGDTCTRTVRTRELPIQDCLPSCSPVRPTFGLGSRAVKHSAAPRGPVEDEDRCSCRATRFF